MKSIKFALPVLVVLLLGFVLAGCPKDDKMMKGDVSQPHVEQIG